MKKSIFYLLIVFIISCNPDNIVPIKNTELNLVEEEIVPIEEEEVPIEEEMLPEEVFPDGSLNSFFNNCLISDRSSNIARKNPIQITEYDQVNNRVKTNYSNLENLW